MICTTERFDSKTIQGQGLNYVKYVPEQPVDGKLPLFIYIHGAGGRGDNLEIIKTAGAMDEFASGREVGAICVAPPMLRPYMV